MKVYEIIYQQIGGHKLKAMTGATVLHEGENTLILKIKMRGSKYNHIDITLNAWDTYDVTFIKYGNAKTGFAVKDEQKFNDIYADGLKQLIESETGLALSLF